MKKCPYCGTDNNDDAVVCQKCCAGLPVGEAKYKETKHEETHASRKKARS